MLPFPVKKLVAGPFLSYTASPSLCVHLWSWGSLGFVPDV